MYVRGALGSEGKTFRKVIPPPGAFPVYPPVYFPAVLFAA